MVIDIMKFTFLYLLVLFAFSCGMNQLLWYYADLEKQACMDDLKAHSNNQTTMHAVSGRKSNKMAYERDDKITIEINHCLAYRKFAKLVAKSCIYSTMVRLITILYFIYFSRIEYSLLSIKTLLKQQNNDNQSF